MCEFYIILCVLSFGYTIKYANYIGKSNSNWLSLFQMIAEHKFFATRFVDILF